MYPAHTYQISFQENVKILILGLGNKRDNTILTHLMQVLAF